ncbi:MAG TPA: ABC transporter permease [Anaerolineales bacterium]|nr:ABC transporter permease [Anaerolineales bacterium]
MGNYLLRRVFQIPITLLGIIVFLFLLIHLAPGDPIIALAGEYGNEAYYSEMRAKFGLDRPVYEQLGVYLLALVRGDLGYSYVIGQPVAAIILSRLPTTLLLMGTAFLISSVSGIVMGVLAARKPDSPVDLSISIFSLVGYALPVFWLAQMMIFFLAGKLGWFPIYGLTSARERYTGFRLAVDVAHHLALPAAALAVQQVALVTRLTRAGMIDALAQPFATAVRAKGVSDRRLHLRHALRNALLPVVTVLGGRVGYLFTGAVLTETVFAWPGLGRLLLEATINRDYPILMGMFLMISGMVIVFNLLTDIIYVYIDPRIKYDR